MSQTIKQVGTYAPPAGDNYALARGFIVTATTDGTVTINAKVLGCSDGPAVENAVQHMLHRANTQPELLAALEGMLETHSMKTIGLEASQRRLAAKKQARAVLAKAKDGKG